MKPILSRISFKACAISGMLFLLVGVALFTILLLIELYSSRNSRVNNVPVVLAWTPSSSMKDLEYAEKMRKFVEVNGGCELPCWMGMRAGETSLESIFEIYTVELGVAPREMYELEFIPRKTHEVGESAPFYEISIFDSAHGLSIGQDIYVEAEYSKGKGVITRLSAVVNAWQRSPDSYYAQVMERFLLPGMLSELGIPDQAWMSANLFDRDSYTGMPYYELFLYYNELGTLVTYKGDLKERGERLILCPYKGATFSVNQWWPKERVSVESLTERPPSPNILLEQAAGIDIAKFYEIFKEPGSRACLETPAEMWK
ncbi:MAG: hypothetical protein AB1894_18015 [Chloroflexota bacterium]